MNSKEVFNRKWLMLLFRWGNLGVSGIKSTDVEETNKYHPHIHLNMYMTFKCHICCQ